METFTILGKTISFDDSLTVYANIYSMQINYLNKFSKKFIFEVNQRQINTMDEFIEHIKFLKNYIDKELNYNTPNEILNILANNNIFDKSIEDIASNCSTIYKFSQYVTSYLNQINDYFNELGKQQDEILSRATEDATKFYRPATIDVLTTSIWAATYAEMSNDIEEYKTNQKRERYVKNELRKSEKEITKLTNSTAQNNFQKFQESVYDYGIAGIIEMFNYCISILMSEDKLPLDLKEHLQKEKARNILNNILRIQDENIKKEQLIVALQAYPFLEEIHSKILTYNIDELGEYIKFIKFIKSEDIILNICLKKSSNSNNEKYISLLKQLDENDSYYQKYINNVKDNTNMSATQNISTINNNTSKINSKLSNITRLGYKLDYNTVFDTFFISAYSIGQVTTQDKSKGHIVVTTPLKIFKLLNPVTIDIQITKIDEDEIIVVIGTSSYMDPNNLSSPRWLKILLDKVNERIK